MRVMVIVKATEDSEAGGPPSAEILAAMGKFNDELAQAGILLSADGLRPSSEGARVRFSGASRIVTDGPFAETKELVAGFWMWEVSSLAEAIEWVKRCPNPMHEDSDIEIRPVYELEDLVERASARFARAGSRVARRVARAPEPGVAGRNTRQALTGPTRPRMLPIGRNRVARRTSSRYDRRVLARRAGKRANQGGEPAARVNRDTARTIRAFIDDGHGPAALVAGRL